MKKIPDVQEQIIYTIWHQDEGFFKSVEFVDRNLPIDPNYMFDTLEEAMVFLGDFRSEEEENSGDPSKFKIVELDMRLTFFGELQI